MQLIRRFVKSLRYRVDNIFARGTWAQLALLLAFSVLVTLLGVAVNYLGLFDPARPLPHVPSEIDASWIDALWWSVNHVLDPATFSWNYGASLAVIAFSLLLTVVGMAIFGAFIGFIAAGIENRLRVLERGNSAVIERRHVLILGWNNWIGAILRQLVEYRRGLTVVILAPEEITRMKHYLQVEGIRPRDVRIILRSGTPCQGAELERVAVGSAHSILLLSHQAPESDDDDIEVIKGIIALHNRSDWDAGRPKLAAQILHHDNVETARIAGGWQVPVICAADIISKVMVHCSWQPGLSAVYSELCGFAGNSIYVQEFPECVGEPFGEVAFGFSDAVLIGVSRHVPDGAGRRWPYVHVLDPGPEYVIAEGEWLILVRRAGPVRYRPRAVPDADGALATVPDAGAHDAPVLILGWNESIQNILEEYDECLRAGTRVDIVCQQSPAACERLVGSAHRNIRPGYRQGDPTLRETLAALPLADYGCILLLADRSGAHRDLDARTIRSLVHLRDLERTVLEGRHIQTVSEITEYRNRELLATVEVDDIVMGPQIVSMLLAQVSQQQMLMAVFEELFSSTGKEIYLRPLGDYLAEGHEAGFDQLIRIAQLRRELAIGIVSGAGGAGRGPVEVAINPDRRRRWCVAPGDQLIVIADGRPQKVSE